MIKKTEVWSLFKWTIFDITIVEYVAVKKLNPVKIVNLFENQFPLSANPNFEYLGFGEGIWEST